MGAQRKHVGLCLGQGGEAAGLGIPLAVRKEEFRVGRSVLKRFASPATSASPHPTTTIAEIFPFPQSAPEAEGSGRHFLQPSF